MFNHCLGVTKVAETSDWRERGEGVDEVVWKWGRKMINERGGDIEEGLIHPSRWQAMLSIPVSCAPPPSHPPPSTVMMGLTGNWGSARMEDVLGGGCLWSSDRPIRVGLRRGSAAYSVSSASLASLTPSNSVRYMDGRSQCCQVGATPAQTATLIEMLFLNHACRQQVLLTHTPSLRPKWLLHSGYRHYQASLRTPRSRIVGSSRSFKMADQQRRVPVQSQDMNLGICRRFGNGMAPSTLPSVAKR
ncbi:hypothetical protein VTI74DRAFT_7662 [Chaetomium olivicolor]